MRLGVKLLLVALAVIVAAVLIGLYVNTLTNAAQSAAYTLPVQSSNGQQVVNLQIQTVAAVGPTLSPAAPDWVSYLVKTSSGWQRKTVWNLPANATIHVTIFNFDGDSGTRNPFLGKFVGVENPTVNGKAANHIDPSTASHIFAVPQLGINIALLGVADNAKNQCGFAPCAMSNAHTVTKFTFHTTTPGHYRWQCFVPCAAGWIAGWGGPMQTIGYMDGFLNVQA